MTRHATHSKPDSPFLRHWLAEALRLRETQREPVDDTAELDAVLQGPAGLDERILRRAALLEKVPYYTTVAGAVAASEGIEAYGFGNLEVRPLQSYFAAA